jgi:hypothetical protein
MRWDCLACVCVWACKTPRSDTVLCGSNCKIATAVASTVETVGFSRSGISDPEMLMVSPKEKRTMLHTEKVSDVACGLSVAY